MACSPLYCHGKWDFKVSFFQKNHVFFLLFVHCPSNAVHFTEYPSRIPSWIFDALSQGKRRKCYQGPQDGQTNSLSNLNKSHLYQVCLLNSEALDNAVSWLFEVESGKQHWWNACSKYCNARAVYDYMIFSILRLTIDLLIWSMTNFEIMELLTCISNWFTRNSIFYTIFSEFILVVYYMYFLMFSLNLLFLLYYRNPLFQRSCTEIYVIHSL